MKRSLWAGLLVFSLLVASFAGAVEKMTLESLGLTVQPTEAHVVLRENTDTKSGEIQVIIETKEADGTQFFLRADPLEKNETVQFAAMDEEELQAFLKSVGVAYDDAQASLLTLGNEKTGLEVHADAERYYGLYAVQDGYVVSVAVASNSHALTDADRQALAELLVSMRWQSQSENAAGAAIQRNARLFARHISTTLASATEATPAPDQQEDADISFQ